MFPEKKTMSSRFMLIVACAVAAGPAPGAFGAGNDVTISNGGLSVTFNLSWGAVVTQHVCIYRHAVNYIGRG